MTQISRAEKTSERSVTSHLNDNVRRQARQIACRSKQIKFVHIATFQQSGLNQQPQQHAKIQCFCIISFNFTSSAIKSHKNSNTKTVRKRWQRLTKNCSMFVYAFLCTYVCFNLVIEYF